MFFDKIYHINDSISIVKKNGKYGFINIEDVIICSPKYDDIIFDTKSEMFKIKIGDKYGLIDKRGKSVCGFIYDYIFNFQNGFAIVYLNEKFGFITPKGILLTEIKFRSVSNFVEGRAIVEYEEKTSKNKFCFIDDSGKEINKSKYSRVHDFKNGCALIHLKGKMGVINKYGEVVVEPKYQNIIRVNENEFAVCMDFQYGLIGINGEEILPTIYSSIQEMNNYLYQ